MKFNAGDRVKWKLSNGTDFFFGEVTIPKDEESKVLPDSGYDYNYDYYPNEELELVDEEEVK